MKQIVPLLFAIGFSTTTVTVDAQTAATPIVRRLDTGWSIRQTRKPEPSMGRQFAGPKVLNRWISARVPGTVQSDLIDAHLLADPWKGEGERAAQWVGLSDWQYRRVIDIDPATMSRSDVDLVFEGLDTFAVVRVNGVEALRTDNMFRTWRISAKALLRPGRNFVEVDLASPIRKLLPKVMTEKHPLPGAYDSAFGDEPKGRQTANYVRKSAFNYGWDFAPRLVTAGIWQPVRLEAYDGIRLTDLHVEQVHLDDNAAVLKAVIEINSTKPRSVEVRIDIAAPDGSVQTLQRRVSLFQGANPVELPAQIDHPQRWWPVGYGKPSLYTVTARISEHEQALGETSHEIGLRTIELRRDKDQWGRGMAFVVNGVPIFAKGANLEPADSIPSRVPTSRTDAILEAAVAANMNMLRVWGGGYYPADAVFAKADRLGLMLWQDFMFGNAIPPNDPDLHQSTRREAIDQVRRLRDHPSLVIWNGNNEVQTGWENWSDRKAFAASLGPDGQEIFGAGLRRLFDKDLRAVVKELSPGTPYWGGSPTADYDGPSEQKTDGDVHFWDVWARSPLKDYLTTSNRFMSEFGLQSMPGLRTTREFLAPRKPDDLHVQIVGSAYDGGKGNGRILDYLRADYGEPRSFIDYIYLSQLFQAEGLEMAVVHQRASRPQNMGTLYWTLNDTWPGLINSIWAGQAWGSIDFHNRWKASHYRARRFYAPLTIGAQRVGKETLVTLISDKREAAPMQWRLEAMSLDGTRLFERGGNVDATPLAATRLATITDADILGTADPARSFAVAELLSNGNVIARQFVYFAKAKELALTDPGIHASILPTINGKYALTMSSKSLARGVWIDFGNLDVTMSDNAFDLAPSHAICIELGSTASLSTLRRELSIRSLYGATSR